MRFGCSDGSSRGAARRVTEAVARAEAGARARRGRRIVRSLASGRSRAARMAEAEAQLERAVRDLKTAEAQ
eukprot:388729-Prorocentrum_minimum.AAC.1